MYYRTLELEVALVDLEVAQVELEVALVDLVLLDDLVLDVDGGGGNGSLEIKTQLRRHLP